MTRSSRLAGRIAAGLLAAAATSWAFAALAEGTAAAPVSAQDGGKKPAQAMSTRSTRLLAPHRTGRTLTWDLNAEGAVGWHPETGQVVGFGRVRGGLSWILNPGALDSVRFWSLSAFYDVSNLSPATIGIQVESLSLGSGSWMQLGGMMDLKSRAGGVMLASGFSIFGVEVQRRFYEDTGHGPIWALYGKIRIPISIIAFALAK